MREKTPLGSLAEKVTVGYVGSTLKHYRDEGVTFLRTKNVSDEGINLKDIRYIDPNFHQTILKSSVKKNDLLLSRVVTDKLKCAIVPANMGEVNCANVILVRPGNELLPSFLKYYIRSAEAQKYLMSKRVGAAQLVVNTKVINNWPIPNFNLDEQKQITTILDEAFTGIDQAIANTEKNLANAKELFESYLNNIFTQKGEGWGEAQINETTTVVNGHAFKSGDFSPSNPVRAIKITNVGVKEFVDDERNNLPAGFKDQFPQKKVFEKDVVVALTRTLIADGLKVAIVPKHYDASLLNQRVAALRPDNTKLLNDFLYYYFCTEHVLQYVKSNVNELMQPNLSIKDLERLLVPLPSINEQTELVGKINAFVIQNDNLVTSYKKKLSSLKNLKQSLLQKAFAGELTSDTRRAA